MARGACKQRYKPRVRERHVLEHTKPPHGRLSPQNLGEWLAAKWLGQPVMNLYEALERLRMPRSVASRMFE